MTDQDYAALRDEIQRLRDEQQRLRDEQERVRRERETSTTDGHGKYGPVKGQNSNPEAGRQDKSADDHGLHTDQKAPEVGDKPNQDPRDENKEERKEQPKPPLRQRARTYFTAHRKAILWGGVGAVLFIIAGVFLLIYLESYESTDDAQVDGHLDPVSSRISGTVTAVYVENNQWVQAGQLLAEMDPRDNQVAVDKARATYAQAIAQLKAENPNVPIINTTNETSISTGQSDLAAAQAAVASAEQEFQAREANLKQALANNEKAQTDVKRYQSLVQKQEVSREQFDTVVATAETMAAGVEAAQASAKAAEKAIDESRARLQQSQSRLQEANQNAPRAIAIGRQNVATRQANVQVASAEMNQAELNLSYLKIVAPVAGVVDERTAEVGARAQAGEQLLVISQMNDIWITANFKETQLKRMRPGQPADIGVDAYGVTFHGYVEDVSGATGAKNSLLPPENATGNYVKVVQRLPVRIRLKADQDPQHILKLGAAIYR